jgi:hypothetical protein
MHSDEILKRFKSDRYEVIEAGVEHGEFIATYIANAYLADGGIPVPDLETKSWNWVKRILYEEGIHVFLLAELGDRRKSIIGGMTCEIGCEDILGVRMVISAHSLYIAPDHRSIPAFMTLFRAAIALADNIGLPIITNRTGGAGDGLFTRLGFKRTWDCYEREAAHV